MKTKLLLTLLFGSFICLNTYAQTPPVNNTMAGAIPITPSAAGTGCSSASFTLPFSTDDTTASGVQGNCNSSGLDQFFTWTATTDGLSFTSLSPGNPGIAIWNFDGSVAIDCASTFSTNVSLNGWNIGDDLIIQIYDYVGAVSDVSFCLEVKDIIAAPINFVDQLINTPGSFNRAVVDMNGDYLDDIVSVSSTNVNIHFQLSGGGFTERNITTPSANFTPSWSISAGDFDKDGFTDLLYGAGSGVTFMKANIDPVKVTNGDLYPYDDTFGFNEFSGTEYVFSQRSNFIDINNDGHLDAFVCHDVEPNVYYINDGSGDLTFYQGAEYANGCSAGEPPTPLPPTYIDNVGVDGGLGIYCSGGNYGSIWIDYDNDGDLDMFIAKCGGETERRKNQMHRNNGDGSFTEVSASLGLDDPMQTWSSSWGDFDNDGDMDVFVGASSGTHKLMRNDVSSSGAFTDVTISSNVLDLVTTGHENLAYDFDNDGNLDIASNGDMLFGNGDMTFTAYENVLPYNNGSFGDLNNDGFVDALVTESGTTKTYMNEGNSNNWIKIHTQGTTSNINGIGARVEIETASGVQIRDVRSGEGFAFMSSLNSHFGIGSDTEIIRATVKWPSGNVDQINFPSINTPLTIIEGDHTLSVEDLDFVNLTIHPNPVNDILNITTPSNSTDYTATVFDISGKRVINEQLIDRTINVSKLQGGIYILRLESNGQLINRKFIKQ